MGLAHSSVLKRNIFRLLRMDAITASLSHKWNDILQSRISNGNF